MYKIKFGNLSIVAEYVVDTTTIYNALNLPVDNFYTKITINIEYGSYKCKLCELLSKTDNYVEFIRTLSNLISSSNQLDKKIIAE